MRNSTIYAEIYSYLKLKFKKNNLFLLEISRGQNQIIAFNPFLFTYDIDGLTVITSLTFKYSCQVIDSNVDQGFPKITGTNQTIYLTDFIAVSSLIPLLACFGSTGLNIYCLLIRKN